jgi:hypothetical protein
MTKISDYASLAGADVDAANDLITALDMSETGTARNKKMTFAELLAALKAAGAYSSGGTDVALADGGTGASLVDPNADRILFWDDSAGAVTWLQAGTGLTISGTTLSADTGAIATAVSTQTGTTYTAVLGDANTFIRFSNASAITFTIPPNSSVAFPVGTVIEMAQTGAGALSVAAGSGVTINSRSSDLTLAGQYAVAFVKKVDTDTWIMNGDL